jgi:hypothetical protein
MCAGERGVEGFGPSPSSGFSVQGETIKGICKSGRIWTCIGDRDHPYIVHHYTPD